MRHPGVYVEEIPVVRPIDGVSTTTAAFLGFSPAGKVGVPIQVESWQDFCHEFAPGGLEGSEGLEVSGSLELSGPCFGLMRMPYAVRGYFENGGRKAVVLRMDDGSAQASQNARQYVQEMAKLDSLPDVSMVVTPETQDEQVVEAVLAQVADRKQAIYLFDAPGGVDLSSVRRFAERFDSDFGALYYPWLNVDGMDIPSAGHVAGVIARTDMERGVYKAPAGTSATVLGIIGTSRNITASERDRLREAQVNPIGSLRGSPVALQGARTLGETYLNVRRALIYLECSLKRGLQQLAFERSERSTWAKAAALAGDFLHSEYRKGALQGKKPQEAYFVKCDATTHTSSDIEEGRLLLLAGVALMRPAEFFTMLIGCTGER